LNSIFQLNLRSKSGKKKEKKKREISLEKVSDKSSTWLLNIGDLISALRSETETPNRPVSLREILDFPCQEEEEEENYQEAEKKKAKEGSPRSC
jgi:hypothetical protein